MAETVVVGLPGTLCTPAVFEPVARALAGEVTIAPFSWLTQPGPWDIPAVAERVASHIEENWHQPVLVCGHSTRGAIALQLAARHPERVAGLVLADTSAHMHGHGDVDAILRSRFTGAGRFRGGRRSGRRRPREASRQPPPAYGLTGCGR